MEKTPIIIPLHPRGGKFRNNKELGYALRSIRKNFEGLHEIILCCRTLPAGFAGCTHLPDGGGGLKTALRRAADAYPAGFLWWYDDCVLLRPQTADDLKVTLASRRWSRAQTSWAKKLTKICDRLQKEGFTAWDYSRPHGPYWFDKGMIDEAFADWPGMAGKFPFESWILSKRDWPRKHGNYRQYYHRFKSPPGPADTLLNYCDKGFTPELIAWLEQHFPETGQPVMKTTKNALSFSLYGSGAKYAVGMIENIPLCRQYYPGWDVVVHAERGHYAIPRLKDGGAIVIEHPPLPEHGGMMWRFESLDSKVYERVIVRDADSRVGPREVAAVDEWIASGKSLHSMRDHQQHKKPIMGCGFGLMCGAIDMAAMMRDWRWTFKYGDDEKMLAEKLWTALKDDALVHRSHGRSGSELPFPSHAPWDQHVGQRVEPSFARIGTRCVLLSDQRYNQRRARFFGSIAANAPELAKMCEWFEGTPSEQMFAPPAFRDVRKIRHWWAATCDHLTIMERAIVANCEHLLLFEDDACFAADFVERFWRTWCCLPKNWKAMRLGWHAHTPPTKVVDGIMDRCDTTSGLMLGTFWNRTGLIRAYDHFWHRRKMIIDMAFADLRKREPQDWYQPAFPLITIDAAARQQGKDE